MRPVQSDGNTLLSSPHYVTHSFMAEVSSLSPDYVSDSFMDKVFSLYLFWGGSRSGRVRSQKMIWHLNLKRDQSRLNRFQDDMDSGLVLLHIYIFIYFF
ncbi:hypothetical protein AMTRI_Chr05g58610 [Amborella trichopoda]